MDAIARIEAAIQQLQTDLAALYRVKSLLTAPPQLHTDRRGPSPLHAGKTKPTGAALAEMVLRTAQGPLHVSEILKRINALGVIDQVPKPNTLTSTLIKYAKAKKVFVKSRQPNTFGLLSRQPATAPRRKRVARRSGR